MIDILGVQIRTCVQKGNKCSMIHDPFGCYCRQCGYMKSRM